MTTPARRLLVPFVASLVVLASACGAPPVETRASWHVVASGVQGVVVADGSTIRGFDTPGRQATWQHHGWLNGAACVDSCASAYLTFDSQPGLFLAQRDSLVEQDVEGLTGDVKVLLATDRGAVVWNSTNDSSRVLVIEDGAVVDARDIASGSPLWFGSGRRGTLFTVESGSASAVEIDASGTSTTIGSTVLLPHGVVCMDGDKRGTAALPDQVHDLLLAELDHVSLCFQGPAGTWIGVSAFISTGPNSPDGEPALAVAGVDGGGELAWTRSAPGEVFALSQGSGANIFLAGEDGMVVLDSRTGEPVGELQDAADAVVTSDGTFVVVRRDGSVQWEMD